MRSNMCRQRSTTLGQRGGGQAEPGREPPGLQGPHLCVPRAVVCNQAPYTLGLNGGTRRSTGSTLPVRQTSDQLLCSNQGDSVLMFYILGFPKHFQ